LPLGPASNDRDIQIVMSSSSGPRRKRTNAEAQICFLGVISRLRHKALRRAVRSWGFLAHRTGAKPYVPNFAMTEFSEVGQQRRAGKIMVAGS
jgi:hypothetical protein